MKKILFGLGVVLLLLVVACAPQPVPQQPSPVVVQPPAEAPSGTGAEELPPTPVVQPPSGTGAEELPPPAAGVVAIEISGFKFVPANIAVKKGTTVRWTNQDTAAHTVKLSDWESEELFQGDTTTRTFNKEGTFPYICGIHPSMKGSVTVE